MSFLFLKTPIDTSFLLTLQLILSRIMLADWLTAETELLSLILVKTETGLLGSPATTFLQP